MFCIVACAATNTAISAKAVEATVTAAYSLIKSGIVYRASYDTMTKVAPLTQPFANPD